MGGDPTIPRHQRGRSTGLTLGWFVDYGDSVVLRSSGGNTWAMDSVSIATSAWGYGEDGVARAPRPFKYDANGATVVEGDVVVLGFLDDHPRLPVILGAGAKGGDRGFLASPYADDAPHNTLRARLRALGADGSVKGEVRLAVHGDGDGEVSLQATDKIELVVNGDLDLPVLPMKITITGSLVEISAGGVTQPVILGTAYLTAENTLAAGVAAFLATLAASAVDPIVKAAAALLAPIYATYIANLTASLTAGTPYLSNNLKTQ